MAIEKVSVILQDADAHGYGVPAFNVFNFETIAWAIEAAEEEKMPIIIQFYPGFQSFIPLSTAAAITKDLASSTNAPIGLHLDHSNSFEQALSGIRYGFPSIMIDGSMESFEENVNLTSRVVECAHALGIEVEAELGHVGSGSALDDYTNPNHFTNTEEAVKFVELTQVDSLAISIGNGHGHYVATPQLDFERIKTIKKLTQIPLVLHGGSDIPDEQLQKAVNLGMNKFNIATEYNRSFFEAIRKHSEPDKNKGYMYGALGASKDEVKAFIRKKIQVLNPHGFCCSERR